eukprot:147589_1
MGENPGKGPVIQKEWVLKKETELRMEVHAKETIQLKLVRGTAEVFGTELAIDRTYSLKNVKIAVFTWHGCTLQATGDCSMMYVEGDTPMVSYVNVHSILENRRIDAQQNDSDGPRVMIVGPTDSGKSALSRILLAYAVRSGRKPVFVDLDVGQNAITMPGNVAAAPIDTMIEVESGIDAKSPIAYFYGFTTPTSNIDLYKHCMKCLSEALFERLAVVDDAKHSGIVVNTCGLIEGEGYDLIIEAANKFKIDTILVLGQDRLYAQIANDDQLEDVTVAKLDKSGGVVQRNGNQRRAARNHRISSYFRGASGELYPHQKVIREEELQVVRLGAGPKAPSTALPIGQEPVVNPLKCVDQKLNKELAHCILAVSYATSREEVLHSNVAGFLHVTKVDKKKKQLTCLTPCPGPLPGQFLLLSNIKWVDK